MSASYSRTQLIGNLGGDVELRYTPAEKAVANFSMAVNERQKNKAGEWVEVPIWWKVTVWDKLAENCAKYLSKGKAVFVDGTPSYDTWQDRDNQTRFTLKINAQTVKFLSPAEGTEGQFSGASESAEPAVDSSLPAEFQ